MTAPSHRTAWLKAALGWLAALLAASTAQAEVRVQIKPSVIRLGTDGSAEIVFTASEDARDVRASCNAGRLGPLEQVAPGTFRATWTPPREQYPQVAIIGASAQRPGGPDFGFGTLPIWGRGQADVETAPHAEIDVRIGDETFGPVTADARGHARVPVIVPPGVTYGLHHRRRIDLGLPPTNRLHVLLGSASLPADAPADVAVRIYVVEARGAPQERARLGLAATRGSLSAVTRLGPGLYGATWHLESGRVGAVALESSLAGERASQERVVIALEPGAAAHGTLESASAEVHVAEQAGTQLRATVLDSQGNLVTRGVRIETTFGTIGELVREGDSLIAHLSLPTALEGHENVELGLWAGGVRLDRKTLRLEPGPLETLVARRVSSAEAPSGNEAVVLHVEGRDRFGNPVPAESPRVAASHGSVQAAPIDARTLGVTFVPPDDLERPADAAISVREGDIESVTHVALQPRKHWLSVAPKAGLLSNLSGTSSATFGAEVGIWSDALGPSLGLLAQVSYFARADGVTPSSARSDFWPLVASLGYRRRLGAALTLWADAGGGLALVRNQTSLAGQPALAESTHVATAQAGLGLGWRLGRGTPFLELRGIWQGDPRLLELQGELIAGALNAGYRFDAL